jgi:hypothetical protein
MGEQNEIVSQVEIGGDNKKEGYCGTNHTSNVSRPFSNENNKHCGICHSREHKGSKL